MYQQFIAKVHEVMQKANEMYNINVNLEVKVNVRGSRIAGVAERKWGTYRVRLNPLFCQQHPQDMLEDTIPHEVAHIVCFALKCCDGHGPNWKRIAKSLGCSGERTHSLSVLDPNKTCYFAVFPNGEKIDIGVNRYNRIMTKNAKFRCKHGQINRDTKFEITKPNLKEAVKVVKTEAKAVAPKAKEITGKVLPKPAKRSAELYAQSNGDFDLFSTLLADKTAQYIKDQFKRAAFHA